jgi:hypothetical protein
MHVNPSYILDFLFQNPHVLTSKIRASKIYYQNNRLLSSRRQAVVGNEEITTITYDNNGNQLTKTTGE